MTSIPSEQADATSGSVRFPPRDQLPPGVLIPKLPAVGTTWYERGLSYWVRRAGATLFLAVMLAAWTAMIGAFVRASGPAGSPAFIGVLVAEVVFSLGTGAWLFYRMWKQPSQRWMPSVRSVSIATRLGSVLLIALWGVAVLLSYGLILALFLRSFTPVPPPERAARSRLADELQKRPRRIPPTAPSGGHPGSKRQNHGRRKH